MAITLSGSVNVNIDMSLVNALDLRQIPDAVKVGANYVFSNGTGADQANEIFADTRTITASGTEDLDLAGGLTDSFGNTLTFTKVKALLIKAAAGNTNDVVVGGDASAAAVAFFGDATDTVKVKPGGTMLLVAPASAGYAITATTADILQIANSSSGTSVTYDIIIIGTV